jgi:hypothetical protein
MWSLKSAADGGRSLQVRAGYGSCDGGLPIKPVPKETDTTVAIQLLMSQPPADDSGVRVQCANLITKRLSIPLTRPLNGRTIDGIKMQTGTYGGSVRYAGAQLVKKQGKYYVALPNLEGINAKQAASILCSLGAHAEVTPPSRLEQPVTLQSPRNGSLVRPGRPRDDQKCSRPPATGPTVRLATTR